MSGHGICSNPIVGKDKPLRLYYPNSQMTGYGNQKEGFAIGEQEY